MANVDLDELLRDYDSRPGRTVTPICNYCDYPAIGIYTITVSEYLVHLCDRHMKDSKRIITACVHIFGEVYNQKRLV